MQAVPFTAFTTKSIQSGNQTKQVQAKSYGVHTQDKQQAFAQTFERAARGLNEKNSQDQVPSRRDTSFAQTVRENDNCLDRTKGSARASAKISEKASEKAYEKVSEKTSEKAFEKASESCADEALDLTPQLLEILHLLGIAGDTDLTGQTQEIAVGVQASEVNQAQKGPGISVKDLANIQQTPAIAMLLKAMTGQDGNLREILRQLQENLQQLSLKLNEISYSSGQSPDKLSELQKALLSALQMSEDDTLCNQDLLIKLAEAVAKFAPKTVASGVNSNPADGTDFEAGISEQTLLRSQTNQNTPDAGDHFLRINTEKSSERSIPGQAAGIGYTGDANGAGPSKRVFGQVEANSIEARQVEARMVGTKQAETTPSEAKDNKPAEFRSEAVDIKNSGVLDKTMQANMKGAEAAPSNSNQGQTELKLQEPSNPSIPNNADFTQNQSSKAPEQAVHVPRLTQVIFGQIAQKAKLLVSPGTTEMQIQLKPDFLGKMNLSISTENGLVTAKFNTESYQVKEVIEANLNTLKDSLAQQGVKVDQLVVSVGTQKDYSGYQEQNHSYYHHNSGKNLKTSESLNEEGFEKLFPADIESRNIQAYYGNTVDFKA